MRERHSLIQVSFNFLDNSVGHVKPETCIDSRLNEYRKMPLFLHIKQTLREQRQNSGCVEPNVTLRKDPKHNLLHVGRLPQEGEKRIRIRQPAQVILHPRRRAIQHPKKHRSSTVSRYREHEIQAFNLCLQLHRIQEVAAALFYRTCEGFSLLKKHRFQNTTKLDHSRISFGLGDHRVVWDGRQEMRLH